MRVTARVGSDITGGAGEEIYRKQLFLSLVVDLNLLPISETRRGYEAPCEVAEREDKQEPRTHSNKLESQGQNLTHIYLSPPWISTTWEIFRRKRWPA